MMHDERFRGALHQIAFSGMGCDNVADRIWYSALESEGYPGERMPQGFAALALAALAVGSEFVLQQLAHIRQDCPCNDAVKVHRERASHEGLHGFGAVAGNVHHAALVLHESDRTIGDQKRERNLV